MAVEEAGEWEADGPGHDAGLLLAGIADVDELQARLVVAAGGEDARGVSGSG
jgi:hypothetical protein